MRDIFSDVDARNQRVQAICLKLTALDPLAREESRTLEILLTQLETLARRASSTPLVRGVGQSAPVAAAVASPRGVPLVAHAAR